MLRSGYVGYRRDVVPVNTVAETKAKTCAKKSDTNFYRQ
jgi:hypothetical protein